jgi:hypothetical protein
MPAKLTVSKETGTTAYRIAGYLIKTNKLENVTEQFRCRLMESLIKQNNNDYRFAVGKEINIPDGKTEIIHCANESFPLKSGATLDPKGWMLTETGYLVKGESGWLVDENGLFILQDGRRLDESHEEEMKLRIGANDITDGLKKILVDSIDSTMQKYKTSELLYNYGPYMKDVVYQAFQINICYATSSTVWQQCTRKQIKYHNTNLEFVETAANCDFKSIGTDETGIPIVVTRIGSERAEKKIIIAGPHGNERMARFVVLETQRYFTEKGVSDPDLALYFIPAMSPTLFFADARGLPFVNGGGKYTYAGNPNGKEKETINNICGFLTIPKLHDFMAEKIKATINRQTGKHLVHDLIQSQENSEKPEYGIDANRDCYNALKSTGAFHSFVESLKTSLENITVIMMHGYEDRKKTENEPYPKDGITGQGAVYGSYLVNGNQMDLNDEMMRYSDLVTLCLFGYKHFKNEKDNVISHKNKYIFENKPEKYFGEWTQKLYEQKISCYDIELAENYRQGTRGKIGSSGVEKKYDPYFVIYRENKMHFFMNKDIGRFVNLNGSKITFVYSIGGGKKENRIENISLSFFNFLTDLYALFEKVKGNCEEVK